MRLVGVTGVSGGPGAEISGWCLRSSRNAARSFFDALDAENDNVSVRHVDPGARDTKKQEPLGTSTEAAIRGVATFRACREDGPLSSPSDVTGRVDR